MTQFFTVTSADPYDKHHYILHFKNGKQVKYEDYDLARKAWMDYDKRMVDYIEVIDISKKKSKSSKGGFA
jgi:hypothetical protein